MEIDRKTVAELVLSTVALVVFVGAAFVVSERFVVPTDPGANASVPPSLTPQGGFGIVAVITVFVLLMAVVGLWMYRMGFAE